jgi:glycosyltransferase involved in cell wall biosynthesis
MRLALIVSHPIQYYVPLYQLLAQRNDLSIKVFFTWHPGTVAVADRGFQRSIAWDIPLTNGYDFECVPNNARDPGTHHFFGLRNQSLIERVMKWKPDAVHITGWAWASHLNALRAFHKRRIPTLFRGDSHLLDEPQKNLRWLSKKALLTQIFKWPAAFLVTGSANRNYYRAFDVAEERLFSCTHSVDVKRFSKPNDAYECEAAKWRRNLNICQDACVVLFAGKFEAKKKPLELMKAVASLGNPKIVMVMVGGGKLQQQVDEIAASAPDMFRILPFQNQSKMPIVYRLGDLFVLPSAYDETWGLAVNEALASNRPVLVSSRVGCAADVIDASCGWVFDAGDPTALTRALDKMCRDRQTLSQMNQAAGNRAKLFDISQTAESTIACAKQITSP